MVVVGLHTAQANFNDNVSIKLCQSSEERRETNYYHCYQSHRDVMSLSQYVKIFKGNLEYKVAIKG